MFVIINIMAVGLYLTLIFVFGEQFAVKGRVC